MDVTYKSRHIGSVPERRLETDCWIPIVDVSWEQGAPNTVNCSPGSIGYFKTIEEAESYVVEIAETWIDAEPAMT